MIRKRKKKKNWILSKLFKIKRDTKWVPQKKPKSKWNKMFFRERERERLTDLLS